MECAECGVRSAVGYCGECETLLCEVCGRTCSQCGKIACRSHLQRTSSGRNICVSCVVLHYDKRARQSKELRERRAEEAALGGKTRKHHRHAPKTENLSFEALARDMGPLAAPIPDFRPEEPEHPAEETGRSPIVVNRGALADADALNARVLTGSASTRTPPWLGGLGMGVVSWVLCFAARGQSESAKEDGILNGVALLISFGTVVWTAPGAFSKEAIPARTWCRVALSVGLSALGFALPNCQGSYIKRATDAMMQNGALPFSQFAYDENSCSKEPSQSEKQRGAQFNIKGYQRLSRDDDDLRTDMLAIKQNVSQGAPVLIGMLVGGSFMQNMLDQELWIPTAEDYQRQGFGGHCMCVIGYDDYKFGNEGGFQIMNSWGPEWGKNGIGWVRYKDFAYFVQEAYGLYPMGSGVQFNENKLKVALGIISNDTKANIPLTRKENNVFTTKTPIKKMSKFKLEVTNNIECYT